MPIFRCWTWVQVKMNRKQTILWAGFSFDWTCTEGNKIISTWSLRNYGIHNILIRVTNFSPQVSMVPPRTCFGPCRYNGDLLNSPMPRKRSLFWRWQGLSSSTPKVYASSSPLNPRGNSLQNLPLRSAIHQDVTPDPFHLPILVTVDIPSKSEPVDMIYAVVSDSFIYCNINFLSLIFSIPYHPETWSSAISSCLWSALTHGTGNCRSMEEYSRLRSNGYDCCRPQRAHRTRVWEHDTRSWSAAK